MLIVSMETILAAATSALLPFVAVLRAGSLEQMAKPASLEQAKRLLPVTLMELK